MNTFPRPLLSAAIAISTVSALFAASLLAAPPAKPALMIEAPWTRATPPQAPVAGGFLTIRNNGRRADHLLSATSPDAERVEIHEMRMDGDMMRMRRLDDGLAIAPNATLELKPGGYHLMFIKPTHPFVAGETVTATLRFEHGGMREVRFEVRPLGSGAPPKR
ncbi:copper chaperone PCu(A)C [Lysobacter hankyongensis]|uniref:Copper chaperone PCu(A)C n=1 Tax=Lysobacter hankyongensis TaxID=1176535 RepID=A0ABP9AQJ1_9GAMM